LETAPQPAPDPPTLRDNAAGKLRTLHRSVKEVDEVCRT
jgi:hypothetical protein